MTTISIVPDTPGATYRAMSGGRQSVGKTPGEALDRLSEQLPPIESGTLLVIQQQRPDGFFSRAKIDRLTELFERWRDERGESLTSSEQDELAALVLEEQQAAGKRAAALIEQSVS